MDSSDAFVIELSDIVMTVTSHQIGGDEVFHIVFSDPRPPLVVYEALGGNRPFWTSIPQGRQKEAEFFGARIEAYLKNK